MFNIKDSASKLLTEVYKDTAQPAAKEGGSTLGRSVRTLLSPARGLLWGLGEDRRGNCCWSIWKNSLPVLPLVFSALL